LKLNLLIRLLRNEDIQPIAAAFAAIGWDKPAAQYERYLAEQTAGERTVLVAFMAGEFAGYVTVCWQPDYPPFRAENTPEIQDFNVLPRFRRQGIGARLMDEAESAVSARYPVVGIGVGLYADYGSAQRMYVKRGYIPDGRGVYYRDHFVQPGEAVSVDDDLVLYFTRQLR
jgi:GNAT superfamily N-acetyltransferase